MIFVVILVSTLLAIDILDRAVDYLFYSKDEDYNEEWFND